MASKMINKGLYLQAGINPDTKLPTRISGNKFKSDFKRFFRIIDEQDAVNRYKWYNLPCNITSQELERMLYYKGQLCFFYMKENNEFYFMPYALNGTIDFYGRFNHIHPVPMTSGTDENKDIAKKQMSLLSTKVLKCVYAPILPEDLKLEDLDNDCVLLHDYTKQLSQNILPRQEINDSVLDIMSEIVPFLRTSLIAGTGIKGVRVNDADQSESVNEASRGIVDCALTGDLWSAITGNIDFQDLTNGQVSKAEEYLLSLQAIDNMRLGSYGLENGGVFQKKAHMLQSEAETNMSSVGQVYQDGLSIRQNFCNIVNSIWGTAIWCEPSETVLGIDNDGDGRAYDENIEGQHSGVQHSNNGATTPEGDNGDE